MGTVRWIWLAAAAWLAAGCAGVPHKPADVRVCTAGGCDPAANKYSAEQLAAGLARLLKSNRGEPVTFCNSDPTTRACESIGPCHFVLGGVLPGNGCAKSITFTGIVPGEGATQLALEAEMPLTFLWTPVQCTALAGSLAMRAADDIAFEFRPRICAWLAVGVFGDTFSFAVEWLDLGQGQVGGYYRDTQAGMAWGSGSGYALLQFPRAMPAGEDWLAERNGLTDRNGSAEPPAPRRGM